MSALATKLTNQFMFDKQDESKVEDKEEIVASDEAPSVEHVINMYQCINAYQKITTDKEPLSDHPVQNYNN